MMCSLTVRCSHGAVDDPDASIIYDQVTKLIASKYSQYQKDIVVMRVPPSDQSELAVTLNIHIKLISS